LVRCVVALVAVLGMLTGCGQEEERVVDVGTRISTAAEALECPDGAEVEAKSVAEKAARVHGDATAAVHAWAERMRRSSDIPIDGYQVAIEEVGRVLFTHDTDNRAEIAVIALRGENDDGDLGWRVESWARCRPKGAGS
jgi:hypothetical protein